jgi:hypothetical protein
MLIEYFDTDAHFIIGVVIDCGRRICAVGGAKARIGEFNIYF